MDDSTVEKRRGERTLVDEILRSAVVKPVGEETEIWGLIINKSQFGVQVALPIEILPKSKVEITITQRDEEDSLRNIQYLGQVRWCRQDEVMGESYNIGLEYLG